MINKSEYERFTKKMDSSIEFLEEDLQGVRAGRANSGILNKITVDYYGVETPISQIAGISIPEARILVIQPWDTSALKNIEKAILKSEIGINPNNDGKSIKLIFPALTEERRLDLIKQIKKKGEDAKVAIRSIRRDAVDYFKVQKKNAVITEDDCKEAEKDIQDITDRKIVLIDKIVSDKDKELMEI